MKSNGNKELAKNGSSEQFAPRARDFKNPKRLTKLQKELVEATREAMKALKDEEARYGKKDFSHF
ncbi:MAG: hypothetical protein ABL999_09685 [Pyrinomonadaceae bacterium]